MKSAGQSFIGSRKDGQGSPFTVRLRQRVEGSETHGTLTVDVDSSDPLAVIIIKRLIQHRDNKIRGAFGQKQDFGHYSALERDNSEL